MLNYKLENLPIPSVDYIVHISDLHIRTLKRHVEYRIVFRRVIKYLQELKNEGKRFIVVITGDIAHSKTDVSAEYFSVVQEFLRDISDITHTIIFLGNHDCNLNNTSRLDAISPVLKALKHPQLFFIKDSGVFSTDNIDFISWSVFDKPSDYIDPSIEIEPGSKKIKIVLYHGIIHNVKTNDGFTLTNIDVPIGKFSGCDFGLCGDIHNRHIVSQKPLVAYAGSLIQQDYTESSIKGGLLWSIKDKTVTEINFKNDYEYLTIEVHKGQVSECPPSDKKIRLRIISYETSQNLLEAIIHDLKKQYNIIDIAIVNRLYNSNKTVLDAKNYHHKDITNIHVQNEVLTEYFKQQDTSTINAILDIHKHIATDALNKTQVRNLVWKIKSFEFSDMFSYGDGNFIDFEKMKGLNGLFASNHTGKTALFDALCWCLFDKCYRTSYAVDVMNVRKNHFECKIRIDINGVEYVIHRKAKRNIKGYFKGRINETVDFYSLDKNQNKVNLNGEQRRDTNNIITQYIGTYEQFILTALSLQENYSSFIISPQRDKKDMISSFAGLDIFDSFYQTASDELKIKTLELEDLRKKSNFSTIRDIDKKITETKKDLKQAENKLTENEILNQQLQDEIIDLTSNVKVLEKNIEQLEKDGQVDLSIEKKINAYKQQSEKNKVNIDKTQALIANLQPQVIQQRELISELRKDEKTLNNSLKIRDKYIQQKNEISTRLEQIEKKIVQLEQLEYDPNCQYCMNNIFVKDAIESKKAKTALTTEYNKLINDILPPIIEQCNRYQFACQQIDLYEKNEVQLKNSLDLIAVLRDNESNIQENLKHLNDKLKKQHSAQVQVLDLQKQLKEQEKTLKELKVRATKADIELNNNKANVQLYSQQIEQLNKNKKAIQESNKLIQGLENTCNYYSLYLEAVHRNGLPSIIIRELVPFIQTQTNALLQAVDFKIEFEVTENNEIQTYIIYNDDKRWSIQLSSGMEKFISSLAIRMALSSITHLPRPNFCVIDEGFGVLDSETVMSLTGLFEYLKNSFEFVIIVSHIDVMRDFVDEKMEIKVDSKGFSNIVA